jgi:hypothetical protein
MGDMLRRAYNGEYSKYYFNPSGERETKEGMIIQYERDFPTAMEMRERENSLTDADNLVLDEIARLLNEARDCTSVTYEGCLSSAVKKFLCEKGYKLGRDRQYNTEYTTISWRE